MRVVLVVIGELRTVSRNFDTVMEKPANQSRFHYVTESFFATTRIGRKALDT